MRRNRLILSGCLLLAALLMVSLHASAQTKTVASNWLHFGSDSAYTSYNPAEMILSPATVPQLEQKWGIGCNDPYFSIHSRSPAIYNGTLYTSGAGDRLAAYDATTGQELWKFGDGNLGWAPQPVVSQDGIVFYMEGMYPTNLYAVDAATGNQLWQAPLGFDIGYSDAALVTVDEANGLVYMLEAPFGPGEGKLYALDKKTGEVIWYKSKITDALSFEGDFVLLGGGKIIGKALMADEPPPLAEGELPPQIQTLIPPDILTQTPPDMLQMMINDYLTNPPPQPDYDHMVIVDPVSQAVETVFEKPAEIQYNNISKYLLCNNSLAVTYVDRDDVFEGAGTLVVYDLPSQTVLWQKDYPAGVTGNMACNPDKNRLYVPTEPFLYALDATSGQEVWKYTGFSPIYTPSIANNVVYFISDTNMYALNEDTGEKIFRFAIGETYENTQVAISNGMVYFSSSGGECDMYALGLPEQ